jgi:hypothetical protein
MPRNRRPDLADVRVDDFCVCGHQVVRHSRRGCTERIYRLPDGRLWQRPFGQFSVPRGAFSIRCACREFRLAERPPPPEPYNYPAPPPDDGQPVQLYDQDDD